LARVTFHDVGLTSETILVSLFRSQGVVKTGLHT
jgi:hypothetical protein